MFGRKPQDDSAPEALGTLDVEAEKRLAEGEEPTIDPTMFRILERLEKVGSQLLVRLGGRDMYTTTVVGLGRDGFFIDTLTPPTGDAHLRKGAVVELEALLGGVSYHLTSRVVSKVQFLDELPAFKLDYPVNVDETRRRKSPRVPTKGTASISFSRPFQCEATVRDISAGGLAFEYQAELGRLPSGTLLGGALLEMSGQPILEIHPEVVGNLVVELGGLSLPSRYRTSVSFTRLNERGHRFLENYIEALRTT
jgi:c-di-GMP-binding flagellar brake protein YcgR